MLECTRKGQTHLSNDLEQHSIGAGAASEGTVHCSDLEQYNLHAADQNLTIDCSFRGRGLDGQVLGQCTRGSAAVPPSSLDKSLSLSGLSVPTGRMREPEDVTVGVPQLSAPPPLFGSSQFLPFNQAPQPIPSLLVSPDPAPLPSPPSPAYLTSPVQILPELQDLTSPPP